MPSISLLNQSLHEWSIEAELPLRTFAVCSDSTVGRTRNVGDSSEDSRVVDLALPSMTDPVRLHARLADSLAAEDQLTVIFSTYQSIDVVAEAQKLGSPAFDVIIYDEAHRTTGVTLAGQEESAFVKVHDDTHLHAAKRLYMTATPRLYDDSTKAKAGQANAVLADYTARRYTARRYSVARDSRGPPASRRECEVNCDRTVNSVRPVIKGKLGACPWTPRSLTGDSA